jgi:hypothetical protein
MHITLGGANMFTFFIVLLCCMPLRPVQCMQLAAGDPTDQLAVMAAKVHKDGLVILTAVTEGFIESVVNFMVLLYRMQVRSSACE